MKKKLQPVIPKSARETAPISSGMRLDDFALQNERTEHLNESLASTLTERTPTPITAPSVLPVMRATKMIATPIDAALRKTLRDLRNEYEVSEAFTIETALRTYFDGRPLADIAMELRDRGGRLRRSK